MPAPENFRANLRCALELGEISQYELARRTKLGRVYINKVLQGTTQPSIGHAEKLAKGAGIPFPIMFLEPNRFRQIMADPSKDFGQSVERELTLESPRPPAPAKKKAKAKAGIENNRMRLWVERLLRKPAAGAAG